MIVTSVLLRGSPMSFRGLLMMLGSLLVHIPSTTLADFRCNGRFWIERSRWRGS
jgi:hypothetical protein